MIAERKSGWTDNSEERNHESGINMEGGDKGGGDWKPSEVNKICLYFCWWLSEHQHFKLQIRWQLRVCVCVCAYLCVLVFVWQGLIIIEEGGHGGVCVCVGRGYLFCTEMSEKRREGRQQQRTPPPTLPAPNPPPPHLSLTCLPC